MSKPPFTMSKYSMELDLHRDAHAYYKKKLEEFQEPSLAELARKNLAIKGNSLIWKISPHPKVKAGARAGTINRDGTLTIKTNTMYELKQENEELKDKIERLETELLIVTGYADQYLNHSNITDMYDELEKAKAEGGSSE